MRREKYHRYLLLIIGTPLFLFIDSDFFEHYLKYAQHLSTLLVSIAYIFVYKRSTKRYKEIMLIGLVIGFVGEFILSIGLGLYYYRLGNIPLWVAFGHGLIYASVHRFIRLPFFLNNKTLIQNTLILFVVIYSSAWLYFANDWFGFLCSVAFLFLLIFAKRSRLFFLVMFVIICYIELVGTTTMTWYWPYSVMNIEGFITSANPPSGIALFYFSFDYIVLYLYFLVHPKIKQRYINMHKNEISG